jgi:alpha-tubulin suppressor-like RCC1 family protein
MCWGSNASGQLGDGTTTTRRTPVAVTGLPPAVAISAGSRHTCALVSDGTVACWGGNRNGQLGDGTTARRLMPVPVQDLTDAVAIAAGGEYACALTSEGTVRCWGSDHYGQLGDGGQLSENAIKSRPVAVVGMSNAVAISTGDFHACAVLSDGAAVCWGDRWLGDGNVDGSPAPVGVVRLTDVVEISASHYHTCALLADGTARCWGSSEYGQVGHGELDDLYVTPQVVVGYDFDG